MTHTGWWSDPIHKIYLYSFFKNFAFFSAVLVPFFTDWGGLTLFQVQLLQSWFAIWVFLLEIPTGAVADKVGRKHSLALGSLIIALAVLIYGSFPIFWVFLLAEFLFAVGYALTSGADQAVLYDTLKSQGREGESKQVLGKADALMMAGMLVAAPLGSLIASAWGLNAPQLMTAIPMLMASFLAWHIPEPKSHSDSQSQQYLAIVKTGFLAMKHNPVVRTLALDSVLVSASVYFVIWFYQPIMSSLGIPLALFGLAHAFLLGTQILVAANFTQLEKVLGAGKKYLRSSAILTTLSFVLVALFPSTLTLIIFLMVGGGIGITRATYISAIAQKHIPSHSRTTTLSSIAMLRRLALVPLNPSIGAVATHSLTLALLVIGLLPLGSLLVKEEVE